jgi:glycosyltransferase involved in cell wall biosynthesis
VENGRTALVVPERDSAALAAAAARILADPDSGRRMGEAARALVQADFGWPRVAERFEAAYDRARTFTPMAPP